MQCKRVTLKLLGLICTAGVCLGASFIWTGGGDPDFDWELCDNWVATGLPQFCYPSTTGDDAIIPYVGSGYAVDLRSHGIGDFSILGSVAFDGAAEDQTLTVESLNIGAASAETVITISGATISVP